ncbi:MAG: hypothetical protein AAGE18_12290 [Pseudomonadota bacterium]
MIPARGPGLYTRLVRWLRIVLPLVALGLLSTLFLFERDDEITGGLVFSNADIAALGAGMRLTAPRFSGATEAGEPVLITADWALPDGPNPREITLANVLAEVQMADGRTATLRSNRALLMTREQTLTLFDNIRLTTSDGYRVVTDRATALIAERVLTVSSPLVAQGPLGEISAQRLRFERAIEGAEGEAGRGDMIWFEGRVRVLYTPAAGTASVGEAGDEE